MEPFVIPEQELTPLRSALTHERVTLIPDLRDLGSVLQEEPPVEIRDEAMIPPLMALATLALTIELDYIGHLAKSGLVREAVIRFNELQYAHSALNLVSRIKRSGASLSRGDAQKARLGLESWESL